MPRPSPALSTVIYRWYANRLLELADKHPGATIAHLKGEAEAHEFTGSMHALTDSSGNVVAMTWTGWEDLDWTTLPSSVTIIPDPDDPTEQLPYESFRALNGIYGQPGPWPHGVVTSNYTNGVMYFTINLVKLASWAASRANRS